MKQKRITLKKDDLNIRLQSKKSEYPEYQRVEVTFPDIYQSELCERYGWNESAVEQFDVHLFGRLQGLDAVVNWEDREFFTIDVPATATEEPVLEVYKSLEKLLSQGPFPNERVNELERLSEQTKEKASQILQAEISKIREDITLFRGYKRNLSAQFGHEGYCIVEMHRIKKTKGLRYDDEEFLGQDKKTVTKSGRVLLDVSLSGLPFMNVYGGNINYREAYKSLFEEELLRLANSPEDVIKQKHRITTTTGDSEHLTFLCSDSFAERVKDYVKQKFTYLDTEQN